MPIMQSLRRWDCIRPIWARPSPSPVSLPTICWHCVDRSGAGAAAHRLATHTRQEAMTIVLMSISKTVGDTLLASVSIPLAPCCAGSLLTDAAAPLPVECAVAACVPDELLHGGYDGFRQTDVIRCSVKQMS